MTGKVQIKDTPLTGTLTTEHAASSYGQPVLVINGTAFGRGDSYPNGGYGKTLGEMTLVALLPDDADPLAYEQPESVNAAIRDAEDLISRFRA